MRIVFMGSPDFAIPSLNKLEYSDHEIVAVVSNPDKRRGRGGKPRPTAVKARAQELDLPTIDAGDLHDPEFHEQLKACNADLFVVVAFRILPAEVLDIPTIGSINLHASLLPKYRGAAPIHWAIMKGEEETGCTVFFLNEKMDAGQLINQRSTKIGENETTGDVYKRLKNLGADLLLKSVDDIANDAVATREQNEDEATPAPKLFTDDAKVDFDRPAEEVHNKIRGLSPFPTAWATLDGKKFNLYRSEIGPDISLENGKLKSVNDQLLVGCSDGTVRLNEVQLEGKKRMSGQDFMNGYQQESVLS